MGGDGGEVCCDVAYIIYGNRMLPQLTLTFWHSLAWHTQTGRDTNSVLKYSKIGFSQFLFNIERLIILERVKSL